MGYQHIPLLSYSTMLFLQMRTQFSQQISYHKRQSDHRETPLERYQPLKGVCINIDSTSNSGHVHFEMHIAQVTTEVIRIHNSPSLKKWRHIPLPILLQHNIVPANEDPNSPIKIHNTKGRVLRYKIWPLKAMYQHSLNIKRWGLAFSHVHELSNKREHVHPTSSSLSKKKGVATHPSTYSITTQHCSCEWGPQFSHQNS